MTRVLSYAMVLTFFAAPAFAQGGVEKGKEVYTANKCQMCHSVADVGNKKGPLDGVGTKYSNADLKAWIVDAPGMTAKTKAERKPAMKAYALPAADVDALVAYMASLKK